MTHLPVIAHQGGWDEILMFLVPVALGIWALRHAEKKSRLAAEEKERKERALADEDDAPSSSER